MTRKTSSSFAAAPGQDSFLDVVTNLVGIMIIIIMVIGTRATDAMVDAKTAAAVTAPLPALDLSAAKAAAVAVEKDIHEIDAKLGRQQLEIGYRRAERDKLLAVLTSMERGFEAEQQQLTATQRTQLDAQRDVLQARTELSDLRANHQALATAAPGPTVLEHLPTPLAKTVFGQEIHFRLAGGRLAYVPWEELVAALKRDAPERVWKLREATQLTETLGPIRGFRMEYTLRRGHAVATSRGSATVSQAIELDHFALVPVSADLGEPVDQVLQEKSELQAILSRYDRNRATVTVWVYPDSYGQFRELKSQLLKLGFLTAGRPMPEGYPIGGSPSGSRSAVE